MDRKTTISASGEGVTANKLTPPLKWFGGKHYLAPRIIDLMPPHLHYVDPYGGGLSVLLQKHPYDPRHQWGEKHDEKGVSEVVNDIHRPLQNFWDVLKDEDAFWQFQRSMQATPFSEIEFDRAAEQLFPATELDVKAASAFFIRCRQSRMGIFKGFATLSQKRTRRKMNEQASAWLNAVEGLADVHARLSRVVILCRDALDVIDNEKSEKTLFYLDPPYLPSARSSGQVYSHEMTEEQHRQMLEVIIECGSMVMLSGYPNALYDHILSDWNRHDIRIDNKASGAKVKKRETESVWCNF